MKINNQDYCDECKRTIDQDDIHDCIWVAKDGREYCDHCYDQVFYPKYYGFSRSDFQSGQAGYIMGKDGEVIKIHKDKDDNQ